jgi:hypothetical protein
MTRVEQDLCPPRYQDPVWVAAGGMGDLYRAVDEVLDRPVAIKLLASRFATDEGVKRRFRREALAAARLSGEPNTVTVFDVGEWRGTPFIVMEYLGGGTLAGVLRGGPQAPARALGWLEQAARSLDVAHSRGVVHRDVKPGNLLLDERGRCRVGDFGIATAAGLDAVTVTGEVMGTAGYLAPEQALGRPVTSASDGYALAAVAYELLTGVRPFQRGSATAEAAAHTAEPVPSASGQNPSLPRAVDRVFETALAKDPADRYSTCAAFVQALRAACGRRPEATTRLIVPGPWPDPAPTAVQAPERRRPRVLAAGLGLLLIGLGGLAGAALTSLSHQTRTGAAATVLRTVTRVRTVAAPPATVASAPAAAVDASQASDLNTRGYELMLSGNYGAALPLLRQAVAGLDDPSNPVTAYANFNLGQTLVRLGQCALALPYLQRAAQLEPGRRQVGDAIGYAQQCAGGGPARAAGAGGRPPGGPSGNGHQGPGNQGLGNQGQGSQGGGDSND